MRVMIRRSRSILLHTSWNRFRYTRPDLLNLRYSITLLLHGENKEHCRHFRHGSAGQGHSANGKCTLRCVCRTTRFRSHHVSPRDRFVAHEARAFGDRRAGSDLDRKDTDLAGAAWTTTPNARRKHRRRHLSFWRATKELPPAPTSEPAGERVLELLRRRRADQDRAHRRVRRCKARGGSQALRCRGYRQRDARPQPLLLGHQRRMTWPDDSPAPPLPAALNPGPATACFGF